VTRGLVIMGGLSMVMLGMALASKIGGLISDRKWGRGSQTEVGKWRSHDEKG